MTWAAAGGAFSVAVVNVRQTTVKTTIAEPMLTNRVVGLKFAIILILLCIWFLRLIIGTTLGVSE